MSQLVLNHFSLDLNQKSLWREPSPRASGNPAFALSYEPSLQGVIHQEVGLTGSD